MRRREVWLAGLLAMACACGDDGGSAADTDAGVILDGAIVDAAPVDASVDATVADAAPPPDANIFPVSLRDTGLYSDFDGRVIAADVQEFVPAYPLWSDGAVKRRWVHLPPGTTIDTSDMDFWVYPEGTKMWKQFESGGVLLETRYMWKAGPLPADWFYVAYGWNQQQTEALEVPNGAVDVLGTTFNIPSQSDCRKCHQRQPDFSLGFSAVQLAHSGIGVTLDSLITDSRLTVPPTGTSPYFPVPGTGVEQEVIGYMHGNCGGCHHKSSDVMATAALNLRLEVASLSTVEETTTYSTIVGPLGVGVDALLNVAGATKLVQPGNPDASAVYLRMNVRGSTAQMPPLGSEVIDTDAVTAVSQWITGLP